MSAILCFVRSRAAGAYAAWMLAAAVGLGFVQAAAASTPNYVVTTNADDAGNAGNCTPQATTTSGTDPQCGLRDALLAASNAGSAVIGFDNTVFSTAHPATNTINVTFGKLTISANTTVQGLPVPGSPGVNQVTVSGPSSGASSSLFSADGLGIAITNVSITVANGSSGDYGIALGYGESLTLTDVTLAATGANTQSPAIVGVYVDYSASLTLINSTVGNFSGRGILIESGGSLNMQGSTIWGNAGGGILSDDGTIIGTNSTVANNSLAGANNGVGIWSNDSLTLTNCTISGNTAPAFYSGAGGIDVAAGTASLTNTIVAGNSAASFADVKGSYTDGGGNVAGNNASGTSQIAINLAPLNLYGGQTPTMPGLPGSPALCAVPSPAAGTDQRGDPRPVAYGSTECEDSGADQTHYALAFTQQPSTSSTTAVVPAGQAITPAPAVTVTESGNFPNGATVSIAASEGTLSGTTLQTTSGGVATFSGLSIATGEIGEALTATVSLNPNLNTPLAISTASYPFDVGSAPTITSANSVTISSSTGGTFTVTATGNPTPSLGAGALPAFATFVDNGNGTGTLTVPAGSKGEQYLMTFKASNGISPNVFQGFALTVTEAPVILSASNATFTAGYGDRFGVIANGYPIVGFSETGALPTGVQLVDNHNNTASIVGIPAAGTGGTYPITIYGSNGSSPEASQSFTLTVDQAPDITSKSSVTFDQGVSGTFTVTTAGFPNPSLSEAGSLPSGVTFTDNGNGTAAISGVPAAGTGGSYPITITASNGVRVAATQKFTFAVLAAPNLVIPAPSSTLASWTQVFQWSLGKQGVTQSSLQVGTTGAGSSDVYNGSLGTATSASVTNIPLNGVTLYVRLNYMLNGNPYSVDYQYTEASIVAPLLQSPAKNSTISGATTFSWTAAAPKPTDYELYLGTGYPGSSNLKFSLIPGSTTSESVTIPANGATVYMTLRYQLDGTWYTESFTFKEAQ